MSETAAVTTAAPAAPAAPATEAPAAPAPAPAAPETQAPATQPAPSAAQQYLSRREVRAAMNAERAARAQQPVVTEPAAEAAVEDVPAGDPATGEAGGPKRDPATGKFLPAGGDTDVPNDAPAADTRAADEAADAGAAERPDKIRIEIPADHPIRGMGIDALSASTPAEEQAIRALVNGTYTRRQENEALRTKLAEVQQQLIQMQASQSAQAKWEGTTEYAAAVERYHEIRDSVGEEAAAVYWKGVQDQYAQLSKQEYDTLMQQVEVQQTAEAAQQWVNEAYQRTEKLPAQIRSLPEFGRTFEAAVQAFNLELEHGYLTVRDTADMHIQFTKYFANRLMREPAVVNVMQSIRAATQQESAAAAARAAEAQRAKEQAEREAVERFKREAAAKRQASPPHPLGGVAGLATADVGATVATPVDESNLSTNELRRRQKAAARQDVRRHFGG